jgi:hypothetical protein
MNKQSDWINNKIRTGKILVIFGVLLTIAGITVERTIVTPDFNLKIITGFGILLIGIGVANLVTYRIGSKDPVLVKRLAAEMQDERTVDIKARAGNRAYWVSTLLIYALLMWSSFSANGSLPRLSDDVLWFVLAGCVLIPFIVYISSIVIEQNRR